MNKLVYNVFKTIAFAMIFVFVWDMVFYLYRVAVLNQRMDNIMTSLQKVVTENNYLPSESAEVFKQILYAMATDFNSGRTFTNANNAQNEDFIEAIGWNVGQNATVVSGMETLHANRSYWTGSGWSNRNVQILHKDMGEVGAYGDVQTIQLYVKVVMPFWGFSSDADDASVNGIQQTGQAVAAGGERGAAAWNRNSRAKRITFTYTSYVPCLKYQSVTQ